jgi:hypothetical protein
MTQPRMILEARAELTEVFRKADMQLVAWLAQIVDLNIQKAGRLEDDAEWQGLPGVTRARLMFHPYDPGSVEGLEAFARRVGADMFDAPTLQVIPDIERLLLDSATEWPDEGEIIMPDEIPWDHGFVWFDSPLEYGSEAAGSVVRAMSWAKTRATLPVLAGQPPRKVRAVRVVFWASISDTEAVLGRPPKDGCPIGDLVLSHVIVIPLAYPFAPVTPSPRATGNDVTSVEAGMSMLLFLHRLWMFMDMEITVMERHTAGRQARKRVNGSLRHCDVNVILLRRARKPDRRPEPGHVAQHVEWTCRWFVRGHYRHLEEWDHDRHGAHFAAPEEGPDKDHCEVCGTRISRWIHPYLKGPSGLPIRHADELFRLAR